jgi:aconitate hydratase
MFEVEYARVWDGDEHWQAMDAPTGALFSWDPDSTYVREPPYFVDLTPEPRPVADIEGARLLALLGDSVTTDHISPPGRSRPTARQGATSASTASSSARSTPTGRAAATTR